MKYLELKFIVFILIVFSLMACEDINQCNVPAKLIYYQGSGQCEYYVELDSIIFEPTNIKDWTYLISAKNEQDILIDYINTSEISTCGANGMLEIICMEVN